MTASLPVPNDIDPEEPDRHSAAPVVPLPASGSGAGREPARKPRTPRRPRKPRMSTAGGSPSAATGRPAPPTPTDPGPPPPLPGDLERAAAAAADLVVPPAPPPPAPAQAESASASVDPEPEAAEPEAKVADPEPEAAEPEAKVAEPEPEVAPAREPAPEPDAIAASEPDAATPEVVPRPGVVADPVLVPADPGLAPDADPDFATESTAEVEPVAGRLADSADAEIAASVPTPVVGPSTGEDVLVLRGVAKRFGSTAAVEAMDLTVPAGTFYGLVGPNGAGKTTTLSMIAGLLQPDRGSIEVGGIDAAARPLAAKRLMGVLPDRLRTFDRLSGRQLLYYYGVLRGLSPAVVESRTVDLARAFDLQEALGRRVSDYSAGMLKKVMLAGALIHSPRLLVLDEPFEAVDPVSSAIILDILSTYVSHGGTVILSSHGMELVERVCSRVAVIVAGQVLAEGTVDEVRGELTLEQRFVELAGGLSDVEGLEWLHTFSG